jgi:hypothetical protein
MWGSGVNKVPQILAAALGELVTTALLQSALPQLLRGVMHQGLPRPIPTAEQGKNRQACGQTQRDTL